MANPVKLQGNATLDTALPVMAAAALGGDANPALQELVMEFLMDRKQAKQKEAEKLERLMRQNAQLAEEQAREKARVANSCSHLKQDNRTTRLAGQYRSDGKLVLVCQFCHTEFHSPADPGEKEPPRHLIPPADEIGGLQG